MTGFKGQSSLNRATPLEKVETNMKAWIDWAFLKQGGYSNINVPTSGAYGGDWSTLYPVTDARFTSGKVWASVRKDWVWETSVGRSPEPIRVSGIYVDDTFKFFTSHTPDAGDTIEGYVDYPNGRVFLESAIATTSKVQASYSYRWVHSYKADADQLIKEIHYQTHRPDNDNLDNPASGDWRMVAESRVQLPAISIEFARGGRSPYQLGGGHYSRNDFLCYSIGENGVVSKRLGFILGEQKEKTFKGFDEETVGDSGAFPLNPSGFLNDAPLNWPDLANKYPFANITIIDTNVEKTDSINKNLYVTPVTLRTETILAENY